MASVFNNTTKVYLETVDTPDYDPSVWCINPDISAVSGVDPMYWVAEVQTDGSYVVRQMTSTEINTAYLATTQTTVCTAIDNYLLSYLNNGFTFGGNSFDCDQRAQVNAAGVCTALANGLSLPSGFTWRTKDNSYVPMDAPTVVGFGASMMIHVNQCYGVCWYHKDNVRKISDVATINSYNYLVGWP